jgi:hypothetical protein
MRRVIGTDIAALQHRRNATEDCVMSQRLGISVTELQDVAFLAFGRSYAGERCERTSTLIGAWHALLEHDASDDDLDAVANAAAAEVVDTMQAELAAVAEALR